LPYIGSMDFMVARNWRGSNYKEQMFDQARQFSGFEKKLIVFLKFYVFWGEFMSIGFECMQSVSCLVWLGKNAPLQLTHFPLYNYVILLCYEL
jgi:hypothetical protein